LLANIYYSRELEDSQC